MSELIYIAKSMGEWVYTLLNAYTIPYINVTPWTLSMSLLIFSLTMKVYDVLTHRKQGQDDNNNKVYRGDIE